MAHEIKVGDSVFPKTAAGLWLSATPTEGVWGQRMENACVLRGLGKVVEVDDIIINYDSWDKQEGRECAGIGEVPYRNCLVECESGTGWAGEGALVKATTPQEAIAARRRL